MPFHWIDGDYRRDADRGVEPHTAGQFAMSLNLMHDARIGKTKGSLWQGFQFMSAPVQPPFDGNSTGDKIYADSTGRTPASRVASVLLPRDICI